MFINRFERGAAPTPDESAPVIGPGTRSHGKTPAGLQGAGCECVSPTDPPSLALKSHDAVDGVGDMHSPDGRGSIREALP
ncbi:MAG: hypothetical protein JF606_29385 [Burkholderiales bacterium]|nr:hypothetical protein [Burkholderiales bacterium]